MSLKKAHVRGSGGATQAAPLRWEQITALLPLLPETVAGWRDRALLAVGHNTLARRAELVALNVEDLDWLDEGIATVALRPTKTDLEASIDVRYLSPPATALVRGWLECSRLETGPLFTRLQRTGQARLQGQRLSVAAVNGILKDAVGRLAQSRGELVIADGFSGSALVYRKIDLSGILIQPK